MECREKIQEILNQPEGDSLKGIIIGRFQKETGMDKELLTELIKSKDELKGVPVIGNVDCSHTAPMISLPVVGENNIPAKANDEVKIEVTEH